MSKRSNKNSPLNKKKWLTLGLVGAALLLIPRRSSRDTKHNNLVVADTKKERDDD